MEFDAGRAAVVAAGPSDAVIGRWPGLILVAQGGNPGALARLLDICATVAREQAPAPGRALARRLAGWLGGNGPDGPGDDLRFGTLALAGQQWATLLSGAVELVVPEQNLSLSGAQSAAWTDRLLPAPDGSLALYLTGVSVPQDGTAVHDLRLGVVPGGGVVLTAGGVGATSAADGFGGFAAGAQAEPVHQHDHAGHDHAGHDHAGHDHGAVAAGPLLAAAGSGYGPAASSTPLLSKAPEGAEDRTVVSAGPLRQAPPPPPPPPPPPTPQEVAPTEATARAGAVLPDPNRQVDPLPATPRRAERILGVAPDEPQRAPLALGGPIGSENGAGAADDSATVVDAPKAQGHLCSRGHLNDPRSHFCVICGIRMNQQTGVLVVGSRPPLGLLVFDDGQTYTVDAEYLVGRMPEADQRVRSGVLRAIIIEDRSGSVSRVHAEVRLNGWDVMLVDSGSRNGTYIAMPNEQGWTPLPPHQSKRMTPGTKVRLGARTFVFESPSGVR